jgi:hypothetical protein
LCGEYVRKCVDILRFCKPVVAEPTDPSVHTCELAELLVKFESCSFTFDQ